MAQIESCEAVFTLCGLTVPFSAVSVHWRHHQLGAGGAYSRKLCAEDRANTVGGFHSPLCASKAHFTKDARPLTLVRMLRATGMTITCAND